MSDYTVPNPAVQNQEVTRKAKALTVRNPLRRPPRRPKGKNTPLWMWFIPLGLLIFFLIVAAGSLLTAYLTLSTVIFPNVSVGNMDLGGMTIAEATGYLEKQQNITLYDEERTWQLHMQTLGLHLDAQRTAEAAFAPGHEEGGIEVFFQSVAVNPIIEVDAAALRSEFERIATNFSLPAVNAGVQWVDGHVEATSPQIGRRLDIEATIAPLLANPGLALRENRLELVMLPIQPDVMDASPLVERASALLSSPLDIRIFDPVTGDSVYWSLLPEEWGAWLKASPDPNHELGLSLEIDHKPLYAYLEEQAQKTFDESRTINLDRASDSIQQAVAAGHLNTGFVQVQHQPREHIVQSGESLTSIGWDYGVPYLYIIEANGGRQSFDVGESIQIPAADAFLKLPVHPDKRIIVDISEQRTRAYIGTELIFDWVTSTGVPDSPTWTGLYQIVSHEKQAYAANWNLYMPNFMGIYYPVPGADFTNGFHGFPTRGGGQLLWENNLGTRVTYGCVMLSNDNMQTLYDWAEDGVIVEIRE